MGPKANPERLVAGKVDRLRTYDKLIVYFPQEDDRGLLQVRAFEAYSWKFLQKRCGKNIPPYYLTRELSDVDRKKVYMYGDEKYKVGDQIHLTSINVFARVESGKYINLKKTILL